MTPTPPPFETPDQATSWMLTHLDETGEECIDNERFAFLDDQASLSEYDRAAATGCCGYFDQDVTVAGRAARVGCNYGH